MNLRIFKNRIGLGMNSEEKFKRYIEDKGLIITNTSQHRDNPNNVVQRHFPDFYIAQWNMFVQVKNGIHSGPYPHVIAQKESVDACWELLEGNKKINIWFVWEMPDGLFKGNKLENLIFCDEIHERNGSGTRGYKILKSCLKYI